MLFYWTVKYKVEFSQSCHIFRCLLLDIFLSIHHEEFNRLIESCETCLHCDSFVWTLLTAHILLCCMKTWLFQFKGFEFWWERSQFLTSGDGGKDKSVKLLVIVILLEFGKTMGVLKKVKGILIKELKLTLKERTSDGNSHTKPKINVKKCLPVPLIGLLQSEAWPGPSSRLFITSLLFWHRNVSMSYKIKSSAHYSIKTNKNPDYGH